MSNNDLTIIPVKSPEEINRLSELAYEIWTEHFQSIISMSQIKYMLQNFQSPEAILEQIQNNSYKYYFFKYGNQIVGYMGTQTDKSKLFLSKIYIKKEYRGKGLAKTAISYLVDCGKKNNLSAIWLTVNKKNRSSINAYVKMNFKITNTIVKDIGNGYVMDDYIMEKEIL